MGKEEMRRLEKQLQFIVEIDKVKNIFRQTYLADAGRKENDAEHSWHIALMAYLLQEYAEEQVNVSKVMLMVLIHDLVEIDAGDTYAYDAAGQRRSETERVLRQIGSLDCFQRIKGSISVNCGRNLKVMRL